jgi:hypothetical protein
VETNGIGYDKMEEIFTIEQAAAYLHTSTDTIASGQEHAP